jgi:hypothetical protein
MAKMFRKTGLPSVTVKDPDTKKWGIRLTKTLDDLSTEQGRRFQQYIDDRDTTITTTITNEYEEYVTNNYGIMLTGQVLVTGGHGARPFWDWVWNAPGASADTAFTIDCEVSSSVTALEKTMTYTQSPTGAITSDFVSSEGPQPQLYEAWDFSVTATDAVQKVAMDHTVNIDDVTAYGEGLYGEGRYGGASGLLMEIITSVA